MEDNKSYAEVANEVNTDTSNSVDDELNDLLCSALDDFKKLDVKSEKIETQPKSQLPSRPEQSVNKSNKPFPSNADEFPNIDFEQFSNVDDVLKSFMEQDPQMKEHWEKLAESCTKAAQSTTDEEFQASLSETLKNLSENAKSIGDNADISQEELAKIWANLGAENPGTDAAGGMMPDIMPLVTSMMQNLLSKDVLYPALKDLTAKYPEWLTANKDAITTEELKRYTKQLELMETVCSEFEGESTSETDSSKKERFQRILVTMQKMQECGSPPKDLVGEVPDMGTPGADFDFSKLAGMPPGGPNQCSVM
ncbi:Peroxisomal biogenesis factor 19 [Halotydeus destructor]|nr:Peroxisomal biogenesis factor 19 [Halotydeus destructor]